MRFLSLPNVLSLSRIPIGLCLALAVLYNAWLLAACFLWIAIATDLLDGQLARRTQAASPMGTMLDHGSDAAFVTLALGALAAQGWAPWALPIIIPAAFIQYALDSGALQGKPLRASALGRYNGIAYFVMAGFPIMQQALGLTVVDFAHLYYLGWGLVITTAISMADRLATLLSAAKRTPSE